MISTAMDQYKLGRATVNLQGMVVCIPGNILGDVDTLKQYEDKLRQEQEKTLQILKHMKERRNKRRLRKLRKTQHQQHGTEQTQETHTNHQHQLNKTNNSDQENTEEEEEENWKAMEQVTNGNSDDTTDTDYEDLITINKEIQEKKTHNLVKFQTLSWLAILDTEPINIYA